MILTVPDTGSSVNMEEIGREKTCVFDIGKLQFVFPSHKAFKMYGAVRELHSVFGEILNDEKSGFPLSESWELQQLS